MVGDKPENAYVHFNFSCFEYLRFTITIGSIEERNATTIDANGNIAHKIALIGVNVTRDVISLSGEWAVIGTHPVYRTLKNGKDKKTAKTSTANQQMHKHNSNRQPQHEH